MFSQSLLTSQNEASVNLFYFPGTCALAVHIILEEIGKTFDLSLVDLAFGDQYKPPYNVLNPKGKIPALVLEDGTLLTELPAIAWYLAQTNPTVGLLPRTPDGEARVLELLDYMVATVHMRGFTRLFRPNAFAPAIADEAEVINAGTEIVVNGLKHLSGALGDNAYLLGEYSIADAALCYLEFWTVMRTEIDLPDNLESHYTRMRARPAVHRALATEGLALQDAVQRALASDDPVVRGRAKQLLEAEAVALKRRTSLDRSKRPANLS